MEGGGFKRRRGHQQQAEHLLGVDIGLLEHVLHNVKHNHLGLLLAVLEGDVDLASLGLAVPHGPPCCTADILCQQVASIRDWPGHQQRQTPSQKTRISSALGQKAGMAVASSHVTQQAQGGSQGTEDVPSGAAFLSPTPDILAMRLEKSWAPLSILSFSRLAKIA